MKLFLLSLAVLFVALLIGYLFIVWRMRSGFQSEFILHQDAAPPPDLPPLPVLLWVSTLVMIAGSVTMHLARSAIRRGHGGMLRILITGTLLLGLTFLALQTLCWLDWSDRAASVMQEDAYEPWRFAAWGFIMLTIVHALHILAGLIPLCLVTARSFGGRYTAGNHMGVAHLTMYWHFLDAVWLSMFAMLLLMA